MGGWEAGEPRPTHRWAQALGLQLVFPMQNGFPALSDLPIVLERLKISHFVGNNLTFQYLLETFQTVCRLPS